MCPLLGFMLFFGYLFYARHHDDYLLLQELYSFDTEIQQPSWDSFHSRRSMNQNSVDKSSGIKLGTFSQSRALGLLYGYRTSSEGLPILMF